MTIPILSDSGKAVYDILDFVLILIIFHTSLGVLRVPTAFPLGDRIGIVAITHDNLHRVHGDKGPPGGEPLSPIDD